MNTFILIFALGAIVIASLVILIYRYTRKEVKQIEQQHEQAGPTPHTFSPGRAHVTRQVTLVGADQHHEGTKKKIKIEAAALPDVTDVKVTPGKGIDELVVMVMNPIVNLSDSGVELDKFEPPLDLTVEYTADDAKSATTDDQGIPLLSLSLGYPADGGWKWEKLHTRVNPSAPGGAGTLHAKIHTLHPKDPIWITRP